MHITVEWANTEHSIVDIIFQRGWDWDMLTTAVEQADALITSVPHTVHLLIDIRQAGGLPGDFITRAGSLFAQGDARPNEGRKIVIGANGLIRMAYGAFLAVYSTQMAGRPLEFAATPEAAQHLLHTPAPF
jgi:hypothetical protein